jgi:hypothetical protein
MFTISIELKSLDNVLKRLDTMTKQLHDFPQEMYYQLDAWQTEDVHFKRPYTVMVDEDTAATVLWPRGKHRPRVIKHPRKAAATAKRRVRKTRPRTPVTLRQDKFDQLVDRMDESMEKCLTWR